MSTLPVTSETSSFWRFFRLERRVVRHDLPPALVSLQETNPGALKDAYFVDTGEPVGTELESLRSKEPLKEDREEAKRAVELTMERWRHLTDAERSQRVERITTFRARHASTAPGNKKPDTPEGK